MAVKTKTTEESTGASIPPAWGWLDPVLLLAGVAVIGVVCNFFAERAWLRLRVDATKTRAYSLSEQTRNLLNDLGEDWSIAIVAGEDTVGSAPMRQVREVLQRFSNASDHIETVAIDPTDPASSPAFEQVLATLRGIEQEPIQRYEAALDEATSALQGFALFIQQQTGQWRSVRDLLGTTDEARGRLDRMLGVYAFRSEQVTEVRREVAESRTISASRPLPDYETARSVLVETLESWAEELAQLGDTLRRWREDDALAESVRTMASQTHERCVEEAAAIFQAADPLKHLPPLELARIARSLEQGEAAVVIGPTAATVISSSQLFPALNLRKRDNGDIAFDQRFRGEQAIAAAIRSLREEHMPLVVFVHTQGESILRRRPANVDVVGAATLLESARFDVAEWVVSRGERPIPDQGQPAVWVVVPPPILERRSTMPDDDELRLIDAVATLIEDGEAVLLNYAPSMLPRTGQRDPWARLVESFGLVAETDRVVFERIRDDDGNIVNQRLLNVIDFPEPHPIASATHGLRAAFDLPVPLGRISPIEGVVAREVVALQAAENRWLETDWMLPPERLDDPTAQERLTDDVPIMITLESPAQRCMVVGSGGWFMSYVADVVFSPDGNRAVLLNPGNHELFLASVEWLAGVDDLIAASPVSRQVARLEGVSYGAQSVWRWISFAGLPGLCLMLGVGVWVVRRR